MAISIYSRLWLAAHLLYPNSSQAFDVYQSLITQTEESIKKNNIHFIFKKLYQIVEKIPAVNSNKAFHVFEVHQTEQWQQIYKKSQKDQLIIFIGYFVFGINLNDISGMLKLTYEKVHFLFHQTFKKSVFLSIKKDIPQKIKFKKLNEEKVSFLFTNENLIDFCLNNLTPQEMKKVQIGLQNYPDLQTSKKQYELIVEQMKNLLEHQEIRVTKPLIQTSEPLSSPRDQIELKTLFVNNKKLVSAMTLSVICLLLVTIRPQWIQKLSQKSHDRFVILQEVKPKPLVTEENQNPVIAKNETASTTPKLKLNLGLPVVQNTMAQTDEVNKNDNLKTTQKTEKPLDVKTNADVMTTTSNLAKKTGGLYRGVLVVTDINEVTPKITERLVDNGAKTAGEVELGWHKTDKLSYYHFTLPENNVDSMKEFLKKFGSLQIQFENHPRLMPAGVKRLIIEVKERE
jgi:hypothetical protein